MLCLRQTLALSGAGAAVLPRQCRSLKSAVSRLTSSSAANNKNNDDPLPVLVCCGCCYRQSRSYRRLAARASWSSSSSSSSPQHPASLDLIRRQRDAASVFTEAAGYSDGDDGAADLDRNGIGRQLPEVRRVKSAGFPPAGPHRHCRAGHLHQQQQQQQQQSAVCQPHRALPHRPAIVATSTSYNSMQAVRQTIRMRRLLSIRRDLMERSSSSSSLPLQPESHHRQGSSPNAASLLPYYRHEDGAGFTVLDENDEGAARESWEPQPLSPATLEHMFRMGGFTFSSPEEKVGADCQDDDVIADLGSSASCTALFDAPAAGEGGGRGGSDTGRRHREAWRSALRDRCRAQLHDWPTLVRREWSRGGAGGSADAGGRWLAAAAAASSSSFSGTTDFLPFQLEQQHGQHGILSSVTNAGGHFECRASSRRMFSGNFGARDERLQQEHPRDPGTHSVGRIRADDGQRAGFRVMQWNVLSQALGESRDSFALCPQEALDWEKRRYRMLEEILAHNADILCLQEVDHFKFLEAHLGKIGYRGSFFAKPDSPCIHIPGNNGPDGCTIFYNAARFQLVRQFTRVIWVWNVQSNQVVLVNILRDAATGRELCVATTHLKAKDGSLLARIRHEEGLDLVSFVRSCSAGRPVVICGDFNATPREPVYSAVLASDLDLGSAYSTTTTTAARATATEPEYTTWKVRSRGPGQAPAETKCTLDYIFYSRRRLAVGAVLDFPSGDDLGPERLPSLRYASDHLSLVCDMQILDEDIQDCAAGGGGGGNKAERIGSRGSRAGAGSSPSWPYSFSGGSAGQRDAEPDDDELSNPMRL